MRAHDERALGTRDADNAGRLYFQETTSHDWRGTGGEQKGVGPGVGEGLSRPQHGGIHYRRCFSADRNRAITCSGKRKPTSEASIPYQIVRVKIEKVLLVPYLPLL